MASYNIHIAQSGGTFTTTVRRGATAPTGGTVINFPGQGDATSRRHEAAVKGMLAVINDRSVNGDRTNWNIYLADSSGNFTTTVRYGVTAPTDGTVIDFPGQGDAVSRIHEALVKGVLAFLNDQQ